jgi:hypothetical protein
MSMKYVTEFAIPMWSGQYSLNYDYAKVEQKCKELGSCTVNLLQYEELKPIHDELTIRIESICNSIDRRFNLCMGDANIFINRPATDATYDLDSTMILIHWIRASKNTGRITYYSNSFLEHSRRFNPYECQLFKSRTQSLPATGKLTVFPSWVPYSVEASSEDDQNISLEIPLYQI